MPFFSRNTEPEEEMIPTHQEQPEMKRGGLFGSLRRDASPAPSAATAHTYNTAGTGRHSTVSSRSSDLHSVNGSVNSHTGSHRSILHRSFGHGNDNELDPSIVAARERVLSAETAEREADRALDIARREVRDARDLVKRLELEAKEEARKAKIKQHHAREVSRRAKPLGRHDI
ncbi:MAG: hypothetical protein STHCBS139747_003518 [Sporothrix thermara]